MALPGKRQRGRRGAVQQRHAWEVTLERQAEAVSEGTLGQCRQSRHWPKRSQDSREGGKEARTGGRRWAGRGVQHNISSKHGRSGDTPRSVSLCLSPREGRQHCEEPVCLPQLQALASRTCSLVRSTFYPGARNRPVLGLGIYHLRVEKSRRARAIGKMNNLRERKARIVNCRERHFACE